MSFNMPFFRKSQEGKNSPERLLSRIPAMVSDEVNGYLDIDGDRLHDASYVRSLIDTVEREVLPRIIKSEQSGELRQKVIASIRDEAVLALSSHPKAKRFEVDIQQVLALESAEKKTVH
jgi:hypothetical protein